MPSITITPGTTARHRATLTAQNGGTTPSAAAVVSAWFTIKADFAAADDDSGVVQATLADGEIVASGGGDEDLLIDIELSPEKTALLEYGAKQYSYGLRILFNDASLVTPDNLVGSVILRRDPTASSA